MRERIKSSCVTADALLGKVVGALTPLMKKELDVILGMDGESQKLEHAITSIGCVLQDAERKHFSDEAVRGWLAELRDVAYDPDDGLDEGADWGLVLTRGPSYGSCAGCGAASRLSSDTCESRVGVKWQTSSLRST